MMTSKFRALFLHARALLGIGLVGMAAFVSLQAQAAYQAPPIAARAYLLLDVTANQILASENIDMAVEPASLTKLMTAYLVFDALKAKRLTLQQTLPVSERAWKMTGSRMFIDPKMQVPVEDLIKGMIVQSGNDATIALAEGVAGTVERFVELMNQQAQVLGMKNTRYKNPEGLTEAGHTTTARDLSILSTALMRQFPQFISYYAIKKYRYAGTPAANDTNRNLLLFRDPTVDGLKTGHTEAAGYCLIATAKRDFPNVGARHLLTVVLGTSSDAARANEAQKLLNWGYTAFDAVRLYAPGQAAATPRVWKGRENEVKLGRPEGIIAAVPSGSAGQVKTVVTRPDPLIAPLMQGQGLGTLKIQTATGELLGEIPLQVLETVEPAGVIGQAWDALRLWLQ